jgi:DnaJ-class molecular chaperone
VPRQRDYYQVLGLPRDANAKAIKNAFRRMTRRYHPDTSSEPDAEQRFREIAARRRSGCPQAPSPTPCCRSPGRAYHIVVDTARGSLNVTVIVDIPRQLSGRQRRL